MTSKQEKLAAARKKLKEFQGKNREIEMLRSKNISETFQHISPKESSQPAYETLPHFSPLNNYNVENSQDNSYGNSAVCNQFKYGSDNEIFRKKSSDSSLSESITSQSWSKESQDNYHKVMKNVLNESPNLYELNKEKERSLTPGSVDIQNNVNMSVNLRTEESHAENSESAPQHSNDSFNSYNFFDKIPKYQTNIEKNYPNVEMQKPTPENTNSNFVRENLSLHSTESKELVYDDGALKDIKSLQSELQNHIQTINILVQQRNDAQIALAQAQNLLTEKSDDIVKLNQYISSLNSTIKDQNYRLLEADETIKKSNLEKNNMLEAKENIELSLNKLQAQYEIKKEECSELKSKYEETDKECQRLLYDLHQYESQLSLCQIQMQQLPSGDDSTLTMKNSELQNENINLKQKLEELERQFEIANAEKEQSSQNFHVYAQRCNSQLNNLNSQVKTLCIENDRLKEEKSALSEKLAEIEDERKNNSQSQYFETERNELLSKINALTEENKRLNDDLKRKEEELTVFYNNLDEKELEIKNMEKIIKELELENRRLLTEIETPKPNERLLAAMESDKVAAAKAVSQNQKLKEQIVELEKAFMKMSQEKLELTDQLAHEKHINSELQKHNQEKHDHHLDHYHEHSHDHNHDHNHDHSHEHSHDHGHDSQCLHSTNEKVEPLVNDSNEVEELRNIVRQLQDDKIELKARLNSLMSNKTNPNDTSYVEMDKQSEEENKEQCENTKLLLSLMEEKVRKTMNEIAILDEEKEKLEHLVLQLQGETETIGEYITLYQRQRMLLRQRAQEKDNQLLQLSKDKEELRSKLLSLDELVQHLLAERQANTVRSDQLPLPSAEIPEQTAERIRALISEIGTTNLVSSNSVAFEHCSCCSGRLITV